MHFQMGLTYYTRRIVSQTMWPEHSEHWVDGLGLRLYLVYLLRDTLPSVDFELLQPEQLRDHRI